MIQGTSINFSNLNVKISAFINKSQGNVIVQLLTATHRSFRHFGCMSEVTIFMKLGKIKYLAVVKYLFLKGNMPTQIKDQLQSVYDSLTLYHHNLPM